jgi:hypothetical protein
MFLMMVCYGKRDVFLALYIVSFSNTALAAGNFSLIFFWFFFANFLFSPVDNI